MGLPSSGKMGVLSGRHPFEIGIFPDINHPAIGGTRSDPGKSLPLGTPRRAETSMAPSTTRQGATSATAKASEARSCCPALRSKCSKAEAEPGEAGRSPKNMKDHGRNMGKYGLFEWTNQGKSWKNHVSWKKICEYHGKIMGISYMAKLQEMCREIVGKNITQENRKKKQENRRKIWKIMGKGQNMGKNMLWMEVCSWENHRTKSLNGQSKIVDTGIYWYPMGISYSIMGIHQSQQVLVVGI